MVLKTDFTRSQENAQDDLNDNFQQLALLLETRQYTYIGNEQCDSDIKSFVNADSTINLLRKGDQVFLNARVGLSSGNASVKDIPGVFDIPLGFRKGSYVGTSWNIACAVGRHGKINTTSNVSWFAVIETERLNFLSTVGGNHYITATWITDDPMPEA